MKTISRRVNRVVRVLLIFLLTFYASAGCFRTAKFEAGAIVLPLTGTGENLMLLQSDKDIFSLDNVTLDMYYGLYDLEKLEERYGGDPKRMYEIEGKMPFFCVYAYDYYNWHKGNQVTDYATIENYYLIKEMRGVDVCKKEYGYTVGFLNYISYNKKVQITIPKELFTEKKGSLEISMNTVYDFRDEKGMYQFSDFYKTRIFYTLMDDGTVKLS